MPTVEPDTDQLLQRILADPRRAGAEARDALTRSRVARDGPGQAAAYRALGLTAHILHDAAGAATELRRAIRTAQACGATLIEAESRMSYALVLDDLGRPAAALREIDHACRQLRGLRLARATMQRALILRRIGRDDDALAGYRRAIPLLRRYGDDVWLGRALVNRGILRGYRGELAPGRADLTEAVELFTRLGLATAEAQARHNLGYLAAQAGDVTVALEHYDLARDQLRYIGAEAVTQLDRAELLLAARLLPEARTAVTEAVDAARAGTFRSLLGQAQLLSARVELESGEPVRARTLAARARDTFTRQARPTWAALARQVGADATIAAGRGDRRALRALEQAGDDLAAASWLPSAWDAWLDAAQLAVDLADVAELGVAELGTAARCLEKADAARRSGPAPVRARAQHVAARIALAEGRVTAAKRHASAGYRELEAHRASLGATELGLRSGAAGVRIAGLRLRLSLSEGDLRGALRWISRVRAVALRLPPARPSDDPVVAARLAELRTITREIAVTALDSPRLQRLLHRQRTAETEVRQRSWRARDAQPGSQPAKQPARQPDRQPELGELTAALGDRVLVELFALDERLHALTVVDGRIRHRTLGTVAAVDGELAALRFAVRRHVVRPGRGSAEAVALAARNLDALLLAPLADLVGTRPLVLAPTGALHGLPWSMLPTCRGRAVSVSPSSWHWWLARRRPVHRGARVLVAGPAPAYAETEVRALHERFPDAVALTGGEATVAGTLAALDGAATGHVASHGVFRADNPLFSHLRLADGPLTVCDLSALRRAPDLLILSSCDAGLSAVHPGDELQGLAVALLGLGTRTVIASLGPVDDEQTRHLMTNLHERLSAGTAPADALAQAQTATDPAGVTASNFVCMGAG